LADTGHGTRALLTRVGFAAFYGGRIRLGAASPSRLGRWGFQSFTDTGWVWEVFLRIWVDRSAETRTPILIGVLHMGLQDPVWRGLAFQACGDFQVLEAPMVGSACRLTE